MTDTTYAIEAHNINKHYGKHHAVNDLTFDVQSGEIFAVLGPNGAGKTSTIRMILDIIKPDSGEIRVLGKPFAEETKNHIGYLPEERGLYRNAKLNDLLVYLGQLKNMSRQDAYARTVALLERVGLAEHLNSKVSELSRGMAQKVQFIATILHHPTLIIVDEPFSGLDPVNTQLIKDILFELRDEGRTIVMSTHQMHQVEAMANRMLMIANGKRVLYGDVQAVRQQYAHNAVIVAGEGDWSAIPGVVAVEKLNHQTAQLSLDAGVEPDSVMAYVANSDDYHVHHFEVAVPDLNEIFIQVAGENPKPEAAFEKA
jgi:ABC-2 type transport system ATP-binding protein